MRRPMFVLGAGLIVSVTVLTGCGADQDASPVVYEGRAGVLESPEHGPEIVAGWIATYPPQADGLPIANWDWSDAPEVQREQGTTWGYLYNLVGTWDGDVFTITEPPTAAVRSIPDPVHHEPTPGCDRSDYQPVNRFVTGLDMDGLGILSGGSYPFDGHCGAKFEAYFDTPELRSALEPVADRVILSFIFSPVETG